MDRPWHEPQVYLLAQTDPRFPETELTTVELDGRRYDVPVSAMKAMQQVLDTMIAGRAVKVLPVSLTMSVLEVSETLEIDEEQIDEWIDDGSLPAEPVRRITWVRLADVLACDLRYNEPRREAGREMYRLLEEERWRAEEGRAD